VGQAPDQIQLVPVRWRSEVMAECLDIVLSKPFAPEEMAAALTELLPQNLKIDVCREMGDMPERPGAIWALVCTTDDPAWPCVLNCLVCGDECGLGPYPDLRIAAWLSQHLGVDALCSTYDFAGNLDPHDPYWALACIGGRWYLGSTCGTRLMGPYTDGVDSFPGTEQVRLVRPVEVPASVIG
jgi:hypothetical protein